MRITLNSADRGTTLLEILVTMVVAVPLLAVITAMVGNAVQQSRAIAATLRGLRAEARYQALIQAGMANLDALVVDSPPRVHHGEIRLSSGALHSVMNSGHPPDPGSDAITFLNAPAPYIYDITSTTAAGSTVQYTACPRQIPDPDIALRQEFIGVTTRGVLELTGTHSGSHCRTFVLNAPVSVSFSQTEDPLFVQSILPIRSHYTLYRSTLGELRYLSHSGEKTLENQPIIAGLSPVRLSLSTIPGRPHLLLTAQITAGGVPHTLSASHQRAGLFALELLIRR